MRRDDTQHGRYATKTSHRMDGATTAARVRPFSFEEIMMRRKSKESSVVAQEECGRVGLKSIIEVVENFSTVGEPARGDKDGKLFSPYMEKYGSEDKSNSRSKEDLSQRGGKSTRGSHDGRKQTKESVTVGSRHEEEHARIKEDVVVKVRAKKFPELEAERRTIAINQLKIKENRTASDLKTRSRCKHEEKSQNNEQRSKRNRVETDKSTDTWSKSEQRPRTDTEVRDGKDSYRDQVVRDRFVGQIGGSFEKESKRKLHNADDRNVKDRSTLKKHDLEVSDKNQRKESFVSRYDEAMIKRKRSKSRDREQDRNKDRRSLSASPKAHKHRSSGGRSHGELVSHSRTDRLGKQHKDVERKFSSNGLVSNYHGQAGSATSGLGGYSPRKRKTQSAIKTPSPTNLSPEKKRAGWDIVPTGTNEVLSSSVPQGSQSLSLSASTDVQELVSAVTAALNMPKLPLASSGFLPTKNNASIDSIQLTESTRPMRRLYVENLPSSTSEKALIECLNQFLLSSGVNHILGTQPCISCMIHKEKCQALLEFLTPEDASAALSFDGSYFSGSVLKIRRPKDFVDMAVSNGDTVHEAKPAATPSMNMTSDIVVDSPYKIGSRKEQSGLLAILSAMITTSAHSDFKYRIWSKSNVFMGGLSAVLSAEMVMEIARAFGPLKAFHLETELYSTERNAFIEYIDPLVTPRACAGLNGMKLGGQMLTVVQAFPDSSSMEHASTYSVPGHAKPLLGMPTTVLKLKNVVFVRPVGSFEHSSTNEDLNLVQFLDVQFTHEEVVSLSQAEVEEVLEDIRLECARFGAIKSVNVVQGSGGGLEKGGTAGEHEEDDEIKKAAGEEIEVSNDDVEQQDEESGGFERGDVLVEYKRIQGCCLAAHCLHGRLFGDRVVMVEYVPLHPYHLKFSSSSKW